MPSTSQSVAPDPVEERRLLQALRGGDERAFTELVETLGGRMRRIARTFVSTDAAAEEIVQETWLAVLAGIDRFEGRSSLRTWIIQILINRAKSTGVRDRRTVPLSALDSRNEGPTVTADRFQGPLGLWSTPPRPWEHPERRALSLETRDRLRGALAQLPRRQQLVVTMRDVEAMSGDEVCQVLNLSAENQRVLLHRGRTALRGVLESYVSATT